MSNTIGRVLSPRTVRRLVRTMSALPTPPPAPSRRVVVTGLGCVTPLGVGVPFVWRRLCAGDIGVSSTPTALSTFPSRVCARVPVEPSADVPESAVFRAAAHIDKAHARVHSGEFITYAKAAAMEAVKDAQLSVGGAASSGAYASERVGVCVGVGVGACDEIGDAAAQVRSDPRRISPYFVPRILLNSATACVSMSVGARGPNSCPSTACSSSAHALGDGFRAVKHGHADAMIVGGSEACIGPLALAGFSRALALSRAYNERPQSASRPFDADRDGFVLGEGAAVLVLEEMEAARRRGARVYAEIRGFGSSGDAFHITAPRDDGSGALMCMEAALREGGLLPQHVDYINAHATSTPVGDNIEALAVGRLLGSAMCPNAAASTFSPTDAKRSERTVVSSTKGAIGHLLGAAGAIESIFTVLSVFHGMAPGTANLEKPDRALPTDVCEFPSGAAVSRPIRAALNNSFGFGGTNTSLLFTTVE